MPAGVAVDEVLETSERYDFQRLFDPASTALDIEDSIPPEKLAPILEGFVERASARALARPRALDHEHAAAGHGSMKFVVSGRRLRTGLCPMRWEPDI